MTIWFWIIAAALLATCMAALLPAMLGRRKLFFVKRSEQTVQAAKNRLTELEAELKNQTITQAQFDSARGDLEAALADELRLTDDGGSERAQTSGGAQSAVWLTVIPAIALGVYYFVGQPQIMELAQETQQQAQQQAQGMDQAITSLEKRLLDNPKDADNWNLLGRSYMSMREYDEAVRAFSRLYKLKPDNLDAATQYAGAIALAAGSFNGKPIDLLLAVMEKDSNHPQALWLSAMAARTQGDNDTAIELWTRLLKQPETDEPLREQIQMLIAQTDEAPMVASNKATPEAVSNATKQLVDAIATESAQVNQSKQNSAVTGASLEVSVELDPALAANVSPNDTLFIFARAVNGPPMPLAVAKRMAGELPIKITLDDTMGMTPTMKLSSFPNVEVVARISKSGTVIKQNGDLEGYSPKMTMPNDDLVQIRIDRVLQ
ncbi:MAG: c-type cytochrome biogenesis protein CcmI [Arenicellales bacterium WSBS_2016_MAG_OTU3]